MKKYEKKQTHNPLIIMIVILIFSTAGFYLLWNLYAPNEDEEKPEGQEPNAEDIAYMEERNLRCPIWAIEELPQSRSFKIADYNCEYLTTGEDLGENVTVEIYTEEVEDGKQEFLNWLTENELSVSDKLRVEYIHKP